MEIGRSDLPDNMPTRPGPGTPSGYQYSRVDNLSQESPREIENIESQQLYQHIHDHIQHQLRNYFVKTFKIEVSTLGFISNCADSMKSMNLVPQLFKSTMYAIIQSVLKSCHNISCLRNSA